MKAETLLSISNGIKEVLSDKTVNPEDLKKAMGLLVDKYSKD